MASFTGTKVKDTYPAILKTTDNAALSGSLKAITDGLGNNSALSLSTAGASVTGTLAVSGLASIGGTGVANYPLTLRSKSGDFTKILDWGTDIGGSWGNITINTSSPYETILSSSSWQFNTSGSEKMRIDSSGNVGIGVTPAAWSTAANYRALQLANASFHFRVAAAEFYMANNTYYNGSNYIYLQSSAAVRYDQVGGEHYWYTAPTGTAGASATFTERMRINSGGFTKSTNDGTYFGSTALYHEDRSSNTDWIKISTNTSASPYGFFINFTGASPNNTLNEFLYCRDGGLTLRAAIRSNGGLANYQANDVNLSDERVKTDISPLGSYWDKIKSIEIVNFKYIDQSHDDFNIGVIAQQVESVAPEFVDIDGFDNRPKVISEEVLDEEGNVIEEAVYEEPLAEPLKAVYTADLYHAAIKVLQEAMARIEVLETELNALKQA